MTSICHDFLDEDKIIGTIDWNSLFGDFILLSDAVVLLFNLSSFP